MKFFKKYYEINLILIAILFVALIIFLFIKAIDVLVINLDKALSIPKIEEKYTQFNLNDAIIILKKKNLIQ
ncbi:MAG: hypothetical protein KatS3mg093_280 [Candidatus Parcubacteria bacterium]|nr:MAG: hypothetical protein KatS3mg093_280 [Candidatus Parcubacteria bacterium]